MAANESGNLLEELKLLASEPDDSLFCCGGGVDLDEPVRLFYSKAEDRVDAEVISFPTEPGKSDVRVEELFKACSPASFGKGNELVYDPEYRSALSMPSERWATSFALSKLDILDQIQAVLAPSVGAVRTQPYKLNVYKKGGFFKPHVDTPRGGNMFGTLVVCLPTTFTGGDFEIEHGGAKDVFAWGEGGDQEAKQSGGSSETQIKPIVKWCAFYSDCTHQVLEVTSGHRITLTYLLSNYSSSIREPIRLKVESSPFVMKLKELLSQMKASGSGEALRFALCHKYAVDEIGDDGNASKKNEGEEDK